MGILKDIETYLCTADRLNDDGVPSVSMALLDEPTGIVQTNVITNGRENAETVYQACSISKAITALAVAKLIDLGRVTYDTKAFDHVPVEILQSIVEPKTAHLMQYVTVGMLVSHRSGLSQHGFPGYAGATPMYEDLFAGRPPSNTPRVKFLSFPGSQLSYSGGGYTLLQIVLENIMAMPFSDIMQEIVLRPLGMSRSQYGDLPPNETNFARAHLTAFVPGTTLGRGYHNFTELAAAGLWTTPSDLLKATSAIQRSLRTNDGTGFLTRQTAINLLTPVTPNIPSLSMAMGWCSDDTFFAHAGDNDPGYQCYVIGAHGFAPPVSKGLNGVGQASLAIMTNSVEGFKTVRKLIAAVFTLKVWPNYERLPCNFGTMADIIPYAGPEGVFVGDTWRGFVGQWTSAPLMSSTPSTPGGVFGASKPTTPIEIGGFGEWELYEDNGHPNLAFEGVEQAMRLMPGATPWRLLDVDGVAVGIGTLVVEGLEMALRLLRKADGEERIELMQGTVTVLRRA